MVTFYTPIDPPIELPISYDRAGWRKRVQAREQYVRQQAGDCWYCKQSLSSDPPKRILDKPVRRSLFPPNFFKHPVHLHHDHKTGMTIGAVHCYCNAVLWQYHGE